MVFGPGLRRLQRLIAHLRVLLGADAILCHEAGLVGIAGRSKEE